MSCWVESAFLLLWKVHVYLLRASALARLASCCSVFRRRRPRRRCSWWRVAVLRTHAPCCRPTSLATPASFLANTRATIKHPHSNNRLCSERDVITCDEAVDDVVGDVSFWFLPRHFDRATARCVDVAHLYRRRCLNCWCTKKQCQKIDHSLKKKSS